MFILFFDVWDKGISRKSFIKPPQVLPIIDFSSPKEATQWIVRTDKGIGGLSTASLEWVDGVGVFRGYLCLDSPVLSQKSLFRPKIDTVGFCVLRSLDFRPPLDLTDYDALSIRCRLDHRFWVSQIKIDDIFQEDVLYQAIFSHDKILLKSELANLGTLATQVFTRTTQSSPFLLSQPPSPSSLSTLPQIPSNVPLHEWEDVIVPFDYYLLTRQGQITTNVNSIDCRLIPRHIRYLSFMMAQRLEGPFEIHIRSITAVRFKKRYG